MAQTCSGMCSRFKKSNLSGNTRYEIGHKWCSLCGLFFFSEAFVCPCCNTRLRSKSRNKKYRTRINLD